MLLGLVRILIDTLRHFLKTSLNELLISFVLLQIINARWPQDS